MILLIVSLISQVGKDLADDLAKITNDVRKLQFARRNISLTKCNDMLTFCTIEDANIFKYRNEIFKTLFCNEPDLPDTLFFQMITYLNNSVWLADANTDYWKQEAKKTKRKNRRVIIVCTLVTVSSITFNAYLIGKIIKSK